MDCKKTQNQIGMLPQVFSLLGALALFTACSKNGSFQVSSDGSQSNSSLSVPAGDTSSGGTTTTPPTTPNAPPAQVPTTGDFAADYKPQALSWESSSHPERAGWSQSAYDEVADNFTVLNQASDIKTFCPTYDTLSHDQKVNLWADVFASTAYYECAWDPTEASVDVGTSSDKDTWSVGLLQLSVVDQQSYGFAYGYDYADLKDPAKNLHLGVSIMARQIKKYGKVLIPVGGSGLYWATLHPGGSYDATSSIATMTKKLTFCH